MEAPNAAQSSSGPDFPAGGESAKPALTGVFSFKPPDSVIPWRHTLGLIGSMSLGAIVGLQLTVTAFILFGYKNRSPQFLETLTFFGAHISRPERDLPIYIAGMLGTVLLATGLG